MDIPADEEEETSVDVIDDDEDTAANQQRGEFVPEPPARRNTQLLSSPSPSPSSPSSASASKPKDERPSVIPGLRFRVQGEAAGQSITPARRRKTSVNTLPPGIAGPLSSEETLSAKPLSAEATISRPRPTSVPPPPPRAASPADLNYQRIVQLRRELRAIKALQNKHERELGALRARAEIFEEQIVRLASAPAKSGPQDADHRLLRKVALLEDRTVIQQSAISEANAMMSARFADLSKRLESLEVTWARRSVASPSAATADDLKRIKGIGQKFEMLLRDAGVTTFEQIASWSDEDVERIAAQMGTSSARIQRDGWIASARRLSGKT